MIAGHWDCPSLGANSRYRHFSFASINFGTSKCELRGLSQLRFSILFFYWVAGKASIRQFLLMFRRIMIQCPYTNTFAINAQKSLKNWFLKMMKRCFALIAGQTVQTN